MLMILLAEVVIFSIRTPRASVAGGKHDQKTYFCKHMILRWCAYVPSFLSTSALFISQYDNFDGCFKRLILHYY